MRLAIIGPDDQVVLAWPTVADAHTDLADLFAERLVPKWRKKRRRAVSEKLRAHILELQEQTRQL